MRLQQCVPSRSHSTNNNNRHIAETSRSDAVLYRIVYICCYRIRITYNRSDFRNRIACSIPANEKFMRFNAIVRVSFRTISILFDVFAHM